MLDLLIKDAEIVDGTGQPGFLGSIGVKDGKIAAVGDIEIAAERIIYAKGLIACPGFVDMHSHTDLRFFLEEPPKQKIMQGITTELLGQDGLGVAPVYKDDVPLLIDLTKALLGKIQPDQWMWRTFEDYLVALESQALPNHVAVLASHGPIRIQTMGMENRAATQKELERMSTLMKEAMESGAYGFSTGLIYPPCSFGDEHELTIINSEVAKSEGIFVVHQRDEGFQIINSFSELIHVAKNSGVHLHVSHLQAYGRASWDFMDAVIEMADQFQHGGGKISWDRYPYLAGCTTLTAVLPPWTFSEGTEALIKNLNEDQFRNRIKEDFGKGLEVWNNRSISVGWENIFVTAVGSVNNKWMEGRSCADLSKDQNLDPVDFVCQLLAEERLDVTMISFYGSDSVLEKVLLHPNAVPGSDGIFGGRPHPRLYGCYPKFFQTFVKEKQLLGWPEAIRKATAYPAEILGLNKRGMIKNDFFADLVLLDPQSIEDKATYQDPEQYPAGLKYVLVNGEVVVENEKMTGKLPGCVLRKGK